jgi:hypothetical protein
MTERERDQHRLAELLDLPDEVGDPIVSDEPLLTRDEEQRLLQEANRVAPPTLAPTGTTIPARPASFGAEALELVRRHPIPALLFGIGLAYLLTRRRRW